MAGQLGLITPVGTSHLLQNASTFHRITTQSTFATLRKMTDYSSLTLHTSGISDAELIPGIFPLDGSHCGGTYHADLMRG